MRSKIICSVVIIAILAAGALFLIERSRPEEETQKPGVELTVSIEREKILKLLQEQTELPGVELLSRFIPESVDFSCRAIFTGESDKPISFSEFSINGQKIPRELYENYLDFSCSLVYN